MDARIESWAHPTALAPLEGIGHSVFLELIATRGGVGLICAPFIPIGKAPLYGPTIRRQVPRISGALVSVQLLGADPEQMAEAAAMVVQAGAEVVDINLGCPARRVVARGAGAALVQDPEAIHRLVARVREAVPGVLSAKMRSGFEDTGLVHENAAAVEAGGADFLVLHPRTRDQGYRGVSDWDLLREVRQRCALPLVGNGDCWYAQDALRMERETGCPAVMIGRGAVRNPWIFEQVAALRAGEPPPRPTGGDVSAWLAEVASRYEARHPGRPRMITGRLKEMVRHLGSAVDDAGAFRRQALRAPDTASLLRVADTLLGSLPAGSLDLAADGPYRFMRSGATTED